jgi:hypothetical protein
VFVDIQYRAGQEEKHTSHQFVDRNLAKKMNVNAWDFELMKVDKVVGHTHRMVSADGKTPTVIKSGTQTGGQTGDGSKFPVEYSTVFESLPGLHTAVAAKATCRCFHNRCPRLNLNQR